LADASTETAQEVEVEDLSTDNFEDTDPVDLSEADFAQPQNAVLRAEMFDELEIAIDSIDEYDVDQSVSNAQIDQETEQRRRRR